MRDPERALPKLNRLGGDSDQLADLLSFIHANFEYMHNRIDPPSSIHHLDLTALKTQANDAEIWALGSPIQACMILTPKADRLYLGKLAIHKSMRGQGFARHMTDHAMARARALGLQGIELKTRVELTENHRVFEALGFIKTAETAHAGYDHVTTFTYQKNVR